MRKKQNEIDFLKKEIEDFGVNAIFQKGNASNEETINRAVNTLLSTGNIRIKMLIHSIAFGTLKPMIDSNGNQLNKKNIDMTLDVMSNNLLYWAQAIFSHKLFSEGSQIIAMTSAGGRKNWDNYGAVSLAKSGLESICRQLSLELAPYKIAVNAIQAGVTETKALKKIPNYAAMIKKSLLNNPHKRLTKTEDVAEFIETLINYESSWMTGNVIRVDGGEDITN